MIISDGLRQENEPTIIYSICKMASQFGDDINQLNDLMTDDNDGQKVYSKNFNFAKECGFIEVSGQRVSCLIPEEHLASYEEFINYISLNVFEKENNFTKLTRWFLKENIEISQVSAEQLAARCHDVVSVDQNYIRGWHWWMIAFGLGTVSAHINTGSRYIIFDCSNALKRFVKAEFKEGEVIKVRSFLTKLLAVKKEFVSSVDLNGNENQITTSISMGLRLLHNLKLVELIYTPDSSDIWHLTESYAHKIKRDITEIKVLRG